MPVLDVGPLPDLPSLRRCLDAGREGFVFTGYDQNEEYVAYKAKRQELLEEACDEDRDAILDSDDPPEEKISKIVCTVAKVQHMLQKLADGEIGVRGEGIGKDGRWDGSNSILPILIKVVEDDCWAESGDVIEDLQSELNVPGRRINRALEDRVALGLLRTDVERSADLIGLARRVDFSPPTHGAGLKSILQPPWNK